jgi:hypothetical protein
MRIDATSLIAAQSVQRSQTSPARAPQPADKPLFEPLNFPKAEPDLTAARARETRPLAASRRPGAQLDITV